MTTVRVGATTPELYATINRSTIFLFRGGGLHSLSVGAKSSMVWLVFRKQHMALLVHPTLSPRPAVIDYT